LPVDAKFEPWTTTEVPTGPDVGASEATAGAFAAVSNASATTDQIQATVLLAYYR
jgi:hypothetical protein